MAFIELQSGVSESRDSTRGDDIIRETSGSGEPLIDPRAARGDDFVDTSWMNIALGIIAAGCIYPCVLAAIFACIAILIGLWRIIVEGEFVSALQATSMMLFGMLFLGFVAGLLGLIWTSFVTFLTLPVAYVIAWSLKLRGSIVTWGAFCGGLIGFVAVLPFMLRLLSDNDLSEFWQISWAAPGAAKNQSLSTGSMPAR
jgi:hypothetical protein